jgi:imidazolonepropionase-like amidohydrolase
MSLLLLFAISISLYAQQKSDVLALQHVTVIDMTGAPPQPDTTVIITGNHISAIGRTGKVHVPNGAQIIDANGKFLIPGLWDMHVHFSEIERTFPLFIANGVTGVRNMGGELDDLLRWRADVARGMVVGPRIVTCGPIIDGPDPAAHGPTIVVGTVSVARKTVEMLKQRGADCVKVYDRVPRDVYFAIIDEARKRDLPVAGHVPLSVTSIEASRAGQKSIEHLGSILESTSTLETELLREESSPQPVTDPSDYPKRIAVRGERMLDTYDERKAEEVFAILARNLTWQVPTLEFKWAQTFIDELFRKPDPRLEYISATELQWWSPEKNFFARYRTPEYIAFRKRLFQKELDLVGALHRAGVPFMAGTDLSGAYVFPGFSLHHELQLLVQAGFTPMEALQTATRNPAMFLGELKSGGTVEKGKLANLVLLDANPLLDIRNSERVNAVILNGRYLSRSKLDQMLADVKASARKN